MKNIIAHLNKAFESRIRLGVMSVLVVSDWTDFSTLKTMLDTTDGNLVSHIAALQKAGYVEVKKKFIERKPNTSYRATSAGKRAFKDHLDALELILKQRAD